MDVIVLIILTGGLLVTFGVLIGCTFSQWLLDARDRRQAAVQRALNEQWKELAAVRQAIAEEKNEPWEPAHPRATSQHGIGQ